MTGRKPRVTGRAAPAGMRTWLDELQGMRVTGAVPRTAACRAGELGASSPGKEFGSLQLIFPAQGLGTALLQRVQGVLRRSRHHPLPSLLHRSYQCNDHLPWKRSLSRSASVRAPRNRAPSRWVNPDPRPVGTALTDTPQALAAPEGSRGPSRATPVLCLPRSQASDLLAVSSALVWLQAARVSGCFPSLGFAKILPAC